MPKFYNSLKRGAVLLITLLVVSAFALGAFVSCSSDSESSGPAGTADLSLSVNTPGYSEDKGLTVISDNNISSGGAADYYWGYTAVKADSYGKTGEKTAVAQLNGTNKGVSSIKNLSVGKWKITLFAYTGTTYNDTSIVYQSTATDVNIKAGSANNISIAVKRVQKAGTTGTLSVKPSEITIASTPYTAFVIDSNGTSGNIDANTMRTPFGKLSEYKYVITYSTNPNYTTGAVKLVDTTANVAKTDTTEVKKSLSAGTYYVKVEVYRTGANAGTTEKPESYVAMFPVQIYSNSTTKIQNDSSQGEYAGLDVKEVKAFKISYAAFTPGTGAADANKASWTSAMQHQPVASDFTDENGQIIWENYPQTHQYGKSEQLDEPTLEGYGFDGYWYKNGSAWTRVAYVPAWTYQDLTLYAKWDAKRYASITYDNNFPVKTAARGDGVSFTTNENTKYSTTGEELLTSEQMPGDPIAPGYVFKGWYIDDTHKGYTNSNPLPAAWKANIAAVCKAQWEPIHYKIVYAAPPAGGGLDGIVPDNMTTLTTYFQNMNGGGADAKTAGTEVTKMAEYDLEDAIIDAENINYGFLGWTTYSDVAKSTGGYDASKIIGVDGTLLNLTAENGKTVSLYPVWSDYFKPVEYIRSYGAVNSKYAYIDTRLVHGYGDGQFCRAVMDIELANMNDPNWNYFLAAVGNLSVGVTGNAPTSGQRAEAWDFWAGADPEPTFGNWFYDQKYNLEVQTSGGNRIRGYIDGELVADITQTIGTANTTAYLMGRKNGPSTALSVRNNPDMRLYSCNMYNAAGKIVRRYIPVVLSKNVPAERTSTGAAITVSDNTKYALWDMVENKFYPNRGSGRFYGPDDEVTITLNNVVTGDFAGKRTQKILKTSLLPGGEKLHKNIFSMANCEFLGWGSTVDASANAYEDEGIITANADVALFTRWTKPVSYNLFTNIDYLPFRGTAFLVTDQYALGTKPIVTFEYRLVASRMRNSDDTTWESTFGTRDYNSTPHSMFFYIGNHWTNGKPFPFICPAFYASFSSTGNNDTWSEDFRLEIGQKNTIVGDFNALKVIVRNGRSTSTDTYVERAIKAGDYELNLKGPLVIGGINETGYYKGSDSDGYIYPNVYVHKNYKTGLFDWDMFRLNVSVSGADIFNLLPCVLNVDLTSSNTVKDATGADVRGDLKVYTGKNCYKGEAGLWDYVSDRFYPMTYGSVKAPEDEFTIFYKANGALGNMADQKITSSADYTPVRLNENRFKYDGYEFTGWNTLPDGSGDWYSPERLIHKSELKNLTLFAQWRQVPASVPYMKLQYIENNCYGEATSFNKAYINSKVNATNSFRYIIDYSLTDAMSYNLFGNDSTYFNSLYGNTLYIMDGVISTHQNLLATANNTRYVIDLSRYANLCDASQITAGVRNNVVVGETNTRNITSSEIHYFCLPYVSNHKLYNGSGLAKIYSIKYYGNDEKLVRDYIPVLLTRNIASSQAWDGKAHMAGELGLWDLCEGKFYSNANSTGYFENEQLVVVKFEANGGSGNMSNQAFEFGGGKVKLNKNAYTKSGCKFIGWNTAADGSGVWYCDEYESSDWKGGELYELYAQWDNTGNIESVNTEYFEPVNYIQTTGKELIVTDIYGADCLNTDISMKVKFDGYNTILFYDNSNPSSGDSLTNGCYRFGLYAPNANQLRIDYTIMAGSTGTFNIDPVLNTTDIFDIVSEGTKGGKTTINGKTYEKSYAAKTVDSPTEVNLTLLGYCTNTAYNNVSYGFKGRVYNMTAVSPDISLRLIPCRLSKKISTYEAGVISSDGKTHNIGEKGFWDLNNNMFYPNSTDSGSFTCELD